MVAHGDNQGQQISPGEAPADQQAQGVTPPLKSSALVKSLLPTPGGLYGVYGALLICGTNLLDPNDQPAGV